MTSAVGEVSPRWAVVANMTTELRKGKMPDQNYTGTPVFTPRTKLYMGEGYWGASDTIHVVGLGRGSRKFVNCIVGFKLLTDVRPQLVYSPGRLATLTRLNATLMDDAESAQALAERVRWQAMYEFRKVFGSYSELE